MTDDPNRPLDELPADATEPADGQDTVRRTRPIRGLVWGLLFGLGLTLVLVVTHTITLAVVPMLITLVVATLIGVAWSLFGPARRAQPTV